MRDFNNNTDCHGCLEGDSCGIFNDSEEMHNMSGITKETFQEMNMESKMDVLFDYLSEMQNLAPKRVRDRDIKCARQVKECDNKFGDVWKAIKRNRILNSGASAAGGFAGGAVTLLAYIKWFA